MESIKNVIAHKTDFLVWPFDWKICYDFYIPFTDWYNTITDSWRAWNLQPIYYLNV
jgi:hypothetical protein